MNKKITVDILMIIAIILEFIRLPILIHIIVGIGLLFLIILHIQFHKKYFKRINKGKYDLKRSIGLIINLGLLISLSITIFSGMLSILIGNPTISNIHKSFPVIILIFLALHLITNHKKLLGQIKK